MNKRYCWQFWVCLSLFWCMMQSPVWAFDTGHHADLTRDVMLEEGFNHNAIEVAQVENWLVDYYSSQPVAGLDKELVHFHFDNLFSDQSVQDYWANLTANTKAAIEGATRDDDPLKVIALLGISLHSVQDFYTHSNWAELFRPRNNRYATNTWFSTGQVQNVFTGRYGQPGNQLEHGSYDQGLNKDSYNRPTFDEAYVFAYSGSYEWVGQVKAWVEAIDPLVWQRAIALRLSTEHRRQLDDDLEAAYRISEWIDVGNEDGHWKGKGSGSNADFAAFVARWTAGRDSIYVDHFKEKGWFRELFPGLDGKSGTVPVAPKVQARSMNKVAVIVRTLAVNELPVGLFESRIDTGGDADFYARVTVQNRSYLEAMQLDDAHVNPDWQTIALINPNTSTVPIQYELWDEDGGVRGDDDVVDINPGVGDVLSFQLNPATQSLSGDVRGVHNSEAKAFTRRGNDGDRAKVRLYVTTKGLFRPTNFAAPPVFERRVPNLFRLIDRILPRS